MPLSLGSLKTSASPLKSISRRSYPVSSGRAAITEIISRDEVDPDTLLSIKKGGSKAAMPSSPEQLRLRLTVLQNALIMRQLRPSRRHHGPLREVQGVPAR